VTASGSPPHFLSPPTVQSTLLTACNCHLLTSVSIARSVNADSLLPSLVHSIPTCCSSVPHPSLILNRRHPIPVRPIALYAVNTVQASPDRGRNLRYDHGPVLAALTHPYLVRSSVIFLRPAHRRFIKSSCSCGAQAQMNLTSLAFLPTTHACAVDGNHHCAALLALPAYSLSWGGGNSRERMPHRLFSVLEGSLLTSEQGSISLLTLRSQSALPLNEGTHCILGRNTASMYVFRD
jgi:hypothetical protein